MGDIEYRPLRRWATVTIVHTVPRCPRCEQFVVLDALNCPACGADLGYNVVVGQFFDIEGGKTHIDGVTW